ncbi:class A beta-lactamase, subclass A2 [Sphingobacterium paludis]|uniref:beta-lactamase n=1 Tax=Sphingobacterium paludis TaxID=1476465 RepID=A0A4V3E1M2_9SPHI|nr:class A beta-lactamase, subclass A2 [Sphingobacterium paludis]TDS13248.1 beta-lactamase class A/beta-lactamase class A VEB [Sphingobacterium paludis]
MNICKFLILLILSSLSLSPGYSQSTSLENQITSFIQDKKAFVAVAIQEGHHGDIVQIHAEEKLPMQSVFKFHIAVAMLTEIDKGTFQLDQPITVSKEDLTPNIWSPLRDDYPQGATIPLSTLLTYMVAQSDNVACDVILKLLGGPEQVDLFFKEKGVKNLAIKINEKTMQSNWEAQFQNWTTAEECNNLLKTYFYNDKKELSPESHSFLWTVMKGTKTGLKRLKGDLPANTVVAHKTGYSGIKEGITEAAHDVGIIFLPDNKPLFISVFVSRSKEELAVNEEIIARIARMTYDFYVQPTNQRK